MTIRALLLICCLALAAGIATAQISLNLGPNLHAGKIGIGLDGITGSPNLLMKFFFTEQLAGELLVGAAIDFQEGDAPAGFVKVTGTTLRAGAGVMYHFLKEQVSPYAGLEVFFQRERERGIYPHDPDGRHTVIAALVLGGEYFMNERFSLGIKERLGAEFGLKRDYPAEDATTRLATETLVTGRMYFN
jgi:hypothetical protein